MKEIVVKALGNYLNDLEVKTLISLFPENPIVDQERITYDDSDVIGYEFFKSGVSLGFNKFFTKASKQKNNS